MPELGTVLIGDVVSSRSVDRTQTIEDLKALASDLNTRFAADLLAEFDYTSGDELQGVLRPGADLFKVLLACHLVPQVPDMRWGIAVGMIDSGTGTAIRRTGEAFLMARAAIVKAKTSKRKIAISTGFPRVDRLFYLALGLWRASLDELTARRRTLAFLFLVEGLPQSQIATDLGVSRATVSVIISRGKIREIGEQAQALSSIYDGVANALAHDQSADDS